MHSELNKSNLHFKIILFQKIINCQVWNEILKKLNKQIEKLSMIREMSGPTQWQWNNKSRIVVHFQKNFTFLSFLAMKFDNSRTPSLVSWTLTSALLPIKEWHSKHCFQTNKITKNKDSSITTNLATQNSSHRTTAILVHGFQRFPKSSRQKTVVVRSMHSEIRQPA